MLVFGFCIVWFDHFLHMISALIDLVFVGGLIGFILWTDEEKEQ